MALIIASTLDLSRPSEKFGTHSTSVDIREKNSWGRRGPQAGLSAEVDFCHDQRAISWHRSQLQTSLGGISMKQFAATMKSDIRSLVLLVATILLLSLTITSAAEEKPPTAWNSHDFQFHVLNTTAVSGSLWICGTDEAIAVSSDDGQNWEVRHRTPDGNSLLNIDFVNDSFGYATGTGGIFLTTEDGGKTWLSRSVGRDTILQASFSDSQHGIIRTRGSLLFTPDGGQHVSVVSDGQNTDYIKRFPYTFALVALDPAHMG